MDQKDKNKQKHPNQQYQKSLESNSFKPSSKVEGIHFGTQLIIKSFTVQQASPPQLSQLLSLSSSDHQNHLLQSTIAFIPTNFTIIAHNAIHTITLGLGTKKTKVLIFVFESESIKTSVICSWPIEIPLGEVNRKLIRSLSGYEMALFKFRKGCITFYVYAVRRENVFEFTCVNDLRLILKSVIALRDFLDHTAILALPKQRAVNYSSVPVNEVDPYC